MSNASAMHPGIVSMPGSSSVLAALSASLDTRSTVRTPQLPKRPGGPIQNPDCVARRGDAFLDNRETCGRAHGCARLSIRDGLIARENLALTLRHEPGSQALREVPKRLPCVGRLHAKQHEARNDRQAEQVIRVSGEAVRECG
jgi:hypothetical protein